MKTILSFLFFAFFSVAVFGQDQLKQYGELMIDMERYISSKPFTKIWKKKKGEWESKCSNAKELKDLEEALEELSLIIEETTEGYEDVEVSGNDLVSFSSALSNYAKKLPADLILKWTKGSRTNWEKKLKAISKGAERLVRAERQKKVDKALEGFEDTFVKVLEDSKKGSFANSKSGTATDANGEKQIPTSVDFPTGTNEIITITNDGDKINKFKVNFDVDGNQKMGEAMVKQMVTIVTKNMEAGYKVSASYDATYVTSQQKVFEFVGEKFADSAKKPTVFIGLLKDSSSILLIVTEPLFKR